MGKEKFLVGELFGFFLLVLGTLVYNEIIEIPLTFMYRNTKRNIEKREEMLAKKEIKRSNSDKASPTAASGDSDIEESEALLNKKN